MRNSRNIRTVMEILRDEVRGDIEAAFRKMTKDYSMTWVYKSPKGGLFPRSGNDLRKEMDDIYVIKGRKYEIKNIAEGKDVVMIEMIESYPDPKTKRVYRTPQVIVLEMRNGKIRRGRHYCDPNISHLHLTKQQTDKAFR